MNDRPNISPPRGGGQRAPMPAPARRRAPSVALLMLAAALPLAARAQPGSQAAPAIPTLRAQWGPSFGGERVFAKPKRDAAMGFSLSTQILEVSVRAGQRVTAGDLLIRGDDREELSRLTQQTHRADSLLQIERAEAAAALAEREYEQQLQSYNAGGGNQLELDRARLTMETGKIDLQIAQWSQQQEKYLADLTQARVDRFHLSAPFDGVVDTVSVDPGDAVRETDPVVRIVDLSELWMDVPTPPGEVRRLALEPGSPAWVMIELGDRPIVAHAQVIHITPTADGASGKQTVRVSVTNTGAWPSGLDTWVRFTEPSREWLDVLAAHAALAPGDLHVHGADPFLPQAERWTSGAFPSWRDDLDPSIVLWSVPRAANEIARRFPAPDIQPPPAPRPVDDAAMPWDTLRGRYAPVNICYTLAGGSLP